MNTIVGARHIALTFAAMADHTEIVKLLLRAHVNTLIIQAVMNEIVLSNINANPEVLPIHDTVG